MRKAISRTFKIEEALKRKHKEESIGLAERILQVRKKMQDEQKAGTYKPIENPRERGREMRKRLKKAGILR